MNSAQTRKRARLFVAEVMKLLPEEYDREKTKMIIEQQQEIEMLQRALLRRDGVVRYVKNEE